MSAERLLVCSMMTLIGLLLIAVAAIADGLLIERVGIAIIGLFGVCSSIKLAITPENLGHK